MFLNKIVSHKYQEVAGKRQRVPLEKLLAKIGERLPLRDFKEAISNKKEGRINIIAEIKKASPSIGMIREDLDILEIARQYELAGAKAISVVTEKNFFKGDLLNLFKVKEVSKLPILSKDFIIDKYQIVEAALYGADAVLLIAAILSKEEIDNFLLFTRELGLSCLVEVHKEEELDKVLSTKAEIIGINNRNLHTFTIDKNTTFKLHFKIPKDKIVISESGINSVEDLVLLEEKGIDAVLIGEVLLRSNDPGAKIKELLRA